MTLSGSDSTIFGKTNSQGRFTFTLSKWPVVVLAKKKMDDKTVLSGGLQITGEMHEATIIMKQNTLEEKTSHEN